MDALRIHGGATLRGEINVSGSKNAALPILVGGLLAPGKSVISRVPDLADIRTLTKLLSHLGAH